MDKIDTVVQLSASRTREGLRNTEQLFKLHL